MSDSRITQLKTTIDARGSQRVVARIRVEVRRKTDGDGFMSEKSHTLVVNAHGALIHLVMKVEPNELLAIKHMMSGEVRHSRVVRVSKEVGHQNEVAVEFTEPAPHFWHIDFPPDDWKRFQE